MPDTFDPRYPLGRFQPRPDADAGHLAACIEDLASFPADLRRAVALLGAEALDAPYRPGGWTRRQLVHHIADSHMNALCRLKLALSEETPTIRPYYQDGWAKLPDAAMPVEVSLDLLAALHQRMDCLWRSLGPDDWARRYFHPEDAKHFDLKHLLQLYRWHGRHHLAQITMGL